MKNINLELLRKIVKNPCPFSLVQQEEPEQDPVESEAVVLSLYVTFGGRCGKQL
jgi:hypothetical protein